MTPTDYDFRVFRITSEISRQTFPLTLDLDNPRFKHGLDRLVGVEREISRAKAQGGIVGKLKQGFWTGAAALTFARLYLLPTKANALPAEIRLAPIW